VHLEEHSSRASIVGGAGRHLSSEFWLAHELIHATHWVNEAKIQNLVPIQL
jgi:hypothetical protein